MLALDRLKEQVAYLKLWQGIVIVTNISLAGWLASATDTAEGQKILLAVVCVTLLSLGVLVLHLQIVKRIEQIGGL